MQGRGPAGSPEAGLAAWRLSSLGPAGARQVWGGVLGRRPRLVTVLMAVRGGWNFAA